MKNVDNQYLATTRLIRLAYYNDYLLENGAITKREHDKMNLLIISKYGKKDSSGFNYFSSAANK